MHENIVVFFLISILFNLCVASTHWKFIERFSYIFWKNMVCANDSSPDLFGILP